jgi:alkylhydroperoxidase/carboxymuconolactone decarboxylase family protein YurZ
MTGSTTEQVLADLAEGEGPILETLAKMQGNTLERSGLDERTYLLVRLASLVAMEAPPASFLLDLAIADEVGIGLDEVRGVLIAVAPVVGSARVVSALSNASAVLR